MTDRLGKKVDRALRLLRAIPSDGGPVEVAYSGGKDSDVILELARMSGIKCKAYYKNTTIDPPGTIAHVKAAGAEIVQPKRSFFQIVRSKGFPSSRSRFCCEELKEYRILDRVVLGIRREESRKRAERYKEPEVCRVYPGGSRVRQYLPILDWTLDDIAEFAECRGLRFSSVYYREDGTLDLTRRVGCIGCPLASAGKRVREYLRYPGILRKSIEALQFFWDSRPNESRTRKVCEGNAAAFFYMSLFRGSLAEYEQDVVSRIDLGLPSDAEMMLRYFGIGENDNL